MLQYVYSLVCTLCIHYLPLTMYFSDASVIGCAYFEGCFVVCTKGNAESANLQLGKMWPDQF